MAITFERGEIAPKDGTSELVSWETVTESDTADAIETAGADGGNVQIIGTFNGGTVVLQGSNDGSNWATVQDVGGNDVSFTAAGIKSLAYLPRYLRPDVSSGTGIDVDVFLKLKKISSKRT